MSTPLRMISRAALSAALLALTTVACSGDDGERAEGGQPETSSDASVDASTVDASIDASTGTDGAVGDGGASTASAIKFIFVITMENHDAPAIIGNTDDAPYINGTLLPISAMSSNFNDELPDLPSEPHYVVMEAGTNAFDDHTFTNDDDASDENSTGNMEHLATQILSAKNGVTWMAYQEDIDADTGACPINSSGVYAAKHDPFVFFQDIAGSPPSKDNELCASHHKGLPALTDDLAAGTVASYNFITPNLCHDMHGALSCFSLNDIRDGDDWLSENLPPIIDFANANSGVIFLVWDEGEDTTQMPFIVTGPGVKPGFVGDVAYDHGSMLRSVEEILELPILPTVEPASDLSDLFQPGFFP